MMLISYRFAAFLFILLILYYWIPGKYQWIILLLASYYFCLWGGIAGMFCPMFTTVTTWFLAGRIGKLTVHAKQQIREQKLDSRQKKEYNQSVKQKQRFLLKLGLILNFGVLAALKYANAFFSKFNWWMGIGRTFNWVLPIGISYYTFQAMGYLIDVYRRKYEPEKNIAKFSLFVCYFPQLTVGPISRYDQIGKELYVHHRFNFREVKFGAERMLWGYFKKLVIADRLKPVIEGMTGQPDIYQGVYALLGMVGYGIWLYMDFSAGIDMVVGISQMLGIRLPENFNRPFLSKTLGEFWRRWHMSLMQWFREYVFFSVSTSRISKKASGVVRNLLGKEAGNKVPAYVAAITVWLITGIWHGISWNYLIWGMANCVVILLSQELEKCYCVCRQKIPFTRSPLYQYVEMFRTFLLFCVLTAFQYWPIRKVFQMLWSIITDFDIFRLWDGGLAQAGLGWKDGMVLSAGIFLVLGVLAAGKSGGVRNRLEHWPATVQYGILFGFIVFVLITGVYGQGYDASQFIYNKF